MPSPFPGMDPYLEAPFIWPDFHERLAIEISAELNAAMPRPYYARVEMRQEVGIVDDEGESPRWRIVSDVAVVRRPGAAGGGGAAVAERTRRGVSEPLRLTVEIDPVPHHFVEIRDGSRGHKLVTLIEVLSPSNKRTGPDRVAYAKKQAEVIESDASLVEIDLLRDGRRVLPHLGVARFFVGLKPKAAYAVLVSPAWMRERDGYGYEIYPIGIRDVLPCVGIPLKADEPVVALDLRDVFDRVYDGGPYRRGAVDYTKPPEPPLTGDDAAWAEAVLRERIDPDPPEPLTSRAASG